MAFFGSPVSCLATNSRDSVTSNLAVIAVVEMLLTTLCLVAAQS